MAAEFMPLWADARPGGGGPLCIKRRSRVRVRDFMAKARVTLP
jgi:hypothetical protein